MTLVLEFTGKRGIQADALMSELTTTPDWPTNTRVLTDQYSPSNLLNAK